MEPCHPWQIIELLEHSTNNNSSNNTNNLAMLYHSTHTNHGRSTEDRRKQALLHLTPKIQQLYTQQPQTSHMDSHLFETHIDDLLTLPTHTLEKWIFPTTIRIKASIKRQQTYNRQQLQPIRNLFQRVIPATMNVKHPTHQLNPQYQNNNVVITQNSPQQIVNPTRYITQMISTFFQRLTPSDPPPLIPIPKSDY
jgi:hypothetical protein